MMEDLRYDYPLTAESVVLDCGGYEGVFAETMAKKYGCTVHVLEPVALFRDRVRKKVEGLERVHVHGFGIGDRSGATMFRIKGDMTGQYADDGPEEIVTLVGAHSLALLMGRCDVMKLNVEGAEFETLQALVDAKVAGRFGNIQVQWHPVVPNAEDWREKLMHALALTHELTWDFGWTWQNWRVRGC